jgi:hypothetical protein
MRFGVIRWILSEIGHHLSRANKRIGGLECPLQRVGFLLYPSRATVVTTRDRSALAEEERS